MTIRTEYADLAEERERVAARLAKPTIAERMARWRPRLTLSEPDPFVWRSAADLFPNLGEQP